MDFNKRVRMIINHFSIGRTHDRPNLDPGSAMVTARLWVATTPLLMWLFVDPPPPIVIG